MPERPSAHERDQAIRDFIRSHPDPIPARAPYGAQYRVSATLVDGTVLPCVVFEAAAPLIDLAVKRFDQTRGLFSRSGEYRSIVADFAAQGNCVNDYDIAAVAFSPFAIPVALVKQIGRETTMGWTAFTGVMKDGKSFQFGTNFMTEFFEMPEGYLATDLEKIIPAERGNRTMPEGKIYRERPLFSCYVDWL